MGILEKHWQTFSAAADGRFWFWADVICADQSDKVDESSQFRLRRFIFQRSRRIVAWLPGSNVTDTLDLSRLETMVATVKQWAHRWRVPEFHAGAKYANKHSIIDVMDQFLTG